jgi:hypothetical protein
LILVASHPFFVAADFYSSPKSDTKGQMHSSGIEASQYLAMQQWVISSFSSQV